MKYLPKDLMNELRIKNQIVSGNRDCLLTMQCKKLALNKIKKTSQIHSYRMENPDARVPFCVSRNNRKKNIREGIKNIEKAFNWGIQYFNPKEFDESFVREIAGRITPEFYDTEIAKYRTSGVQITGASITPPYPYKFLNYEIPAFVESLKKQLECTDVINRIESAIFAHLQIAKIHPFVDGNGRTARTMQDIILHYYGIPIPLIESGERHTYYNCIDEAVLDLDEKKALNIKNGASEGERKFYTFIAGKINTSYDKILSGCH